MRPVLSSLLAASAVFLPSVVQADCHLSKLLDIPVTMRGSRAIVSAQINGKDAEFILDSGAFYSMMSRASAQTYNLTIGPAPPGFFLRGINGETSAYVSTVQRFGLSGVTIPRLQFLVGGTDTGQVGLLGQNFLSLGDVEYDLRHGIVRLLRSQGCKPDDLAYWPGTSPVSMIPLEPRSLHGNHTIGTVTLNGVKLRAVFDTGAPSSVITLSAAKRVGVTPASPGVVGGGFSGGLGTRSLRSWNATFDRLEIGGESIPHPRIRISEADLSNGDMLIGADFFLSHHIYVANNAAKMLFTYEGGTVFGVGADGASDDKGKPLDLTDRSSAPTDAEGLSRRGAAEASMRNFEAAIADFDKAIALAPGVARYWRQRGAARLGNHQPLLGSADIDKALALDPADADALLMRASVRLLAHDPEGAAVDIKALDKLLPASSSQRLELAGMADAAGLLDVALANDNAWLRTHPEDAQRPVALNGRCWVRAKLNQELKLALDDCNAAIKARPSTAAYLDSRGLVRLRQSDLAGALADYDAALRLQPANPWTLYMRGVVKRRLGDTAGAEADRKAALALAPRTADHAAKLGLAN